LAFREDINGLRAIAVIAVVIFHFNPSWLPGGFAGVDVFFVISGYLMTKIILTKLDHNSFSVIGFYKARAQRIVPALAALCIVLLVFGWFYLTPKDYQELGKHISSSISFLSNIVYWREAGYFDLSSHKKWLLHTWSLSAEWQFYIIYPVMLIVISRVLKPAAMKVTLFLATIIGFSFCIYASHQWPNMSYYLLPTRAWEMLLGGLVFIYPLTLNSNRKKIVEIIGLVLIVLSYIFISSEDIWPGTLATIPVLGAFLILQAQRQGSVFTSNYIFQKIGVWSYSIYLWHWPFVVLKGYFQLSDFWVLPLMLSSLMMAYISYELIEKKKLPTLVLFIITLTLSLAIWNFQGVESRFDTSKNGSTLQESLFRYGGEGFTHSGVLGTKDSSILIVGDSYAKQYLFGLNKQNISLHYMTNFGCLILPDITRFTKGREVPSCTLMYQKVLDYIAVNNIETIVFASSWSKGSSRSGYKSGTALSFKDDNKAAELISEQLLKMIDEIGIGKEYFIIPDTQGDEYSTADCIYKNQYFQNECQPLTTKISNIMTAHFSKESDLKENITMINPNNYFCTDKHCRLIDNGYPIYFDKTHYSKYGSVEVASYIIKQLFKKEVGEQD
jgi:peptidoglycan/LPS O-acetylase OafA/YrhL